MIWIYIIAFILLAFVGFVVTILFFMRRNELTSTYFKRIGYFKKPSLLFILKIVKRHILLYLGKTQIMSVMISPSRQCNANCVHCYEKFSDMKNDFMTTDTLKSVIYQVKKLNGFMIQFCSGEFLMRDDAIEIIRYVKSLGLEPSITTNGILLPEKLDDLIDAGIFHIAVSIDSADPEKHDELRKSKGCFAKAKEGLELAKQKGVFTEIWTYVTKDINYNFDNLDKIIELGKEWGVANIYVYFPLLSGHMYNKFDENLSFEEREAYRKRYNGKKGVMLEFSTEKSLCRGGGKIHISIMPSGEVTFCPVVPYTYGNIHEKSLKECLLAIREDYKKFVKKDCVGQCIVNFPEYRENSKGKFIYEKNITS